MIVIGELILKDPLLPVKVVPFNCIKFELYSSKTA